MHTKKGGITMSMFFNYDVPFGTNLLSRVMFRQSINHKID